MLAGTSGLRSLPIMFATRLARVQAAMEAANVDMLLLSVGPDLPWIMGYEAMPLERLTMLVVPRDDIASLVIPAFEVPRVVEHPDVFQIHGWGETDDPIARVVDKVGAAGTLAIGDHTWSRFTVALQDAMPGRTWKSSGQIVGPLRAIKDEAEIAALQRAADGVDRIAAELQSGQIPLIGRTEADVSAQLGARILEEGHAKVNFAIVAAGENASSPHHHASDRVIKANEVVLCDFGGTTTEPHGQPGYCSDITRCVYTGEPPAEFAEAYGVLQRSQAAATAAATVGTVLQDIDRVARSGMAEGELEQWFLHRLGHGIGVEAHEDPYLVEGNTDLLEAGNAFSIEPGFYIADKWGARLEDIVIATGHGPVSLNKANRDLAVVEA